MSRSGQSVVPGLVEVLRTSPSIRILDPVQHTAPAGFDDQHVGVVAGLGMLGDLEDERPAVDEDFVLEDSLCRVVRFLSRGGTERAEDASCPVIELSVDGDDEERLVGA